MVKLILVRGLPGSGKTTFAWKKKSYIEDSGQSAVVVAADDFMVDWLGNYKFDPSKLNWCHTMCFNIASNWLSNNTTVIVHNTFTRISEMKQYIHLAEKLNIPLEVIRMTTQFKSVHGVPEETMMRMKARFQDYEGEIYV